MKEAFAEATNSTVSAISSGVPMRFNGTNEAKYFLPSSSGAQRSSMGVWTGPGATAFTRTPKRCGLECRRLAGHNDLRIFICKGDSSGSANARQSSRDQYNLF